MIYFSHSQNIDNIYYETEYRKEWCTSNEKPAPCFLFARKFTRGAGLKLLDSVSPGPSVISFVSLLFFT
jgi:hypothetical protein